MGPSEFVPSEAPETPLHSTGTLCVANSTLTLMAIGAVLEHPIRVTGAVPSLQLAAGGSPFILPLGTSGPAGIIS